MNRQKLTRSQVREIKRKMAKTNKRKIKDIKAYKRLLVLHMRVLGKSNKEISEVVGFASSYITEIVSKYLKNGLDALLNDGRTSNNRRLSFDEETAFLEQFIDLAEAGQIVTINGIVEKFEELTGKPSNTTTLYQLLKRHGWRKIKPRPEHPNKPSEADIEASKKLTKNTERSYWKKIEETNETEASSTIV